MRIHLRAAFPAIISVGLAAGLAVTTPAWAGTSAPRTGTGGFHDTLGAVAAISASDAWAVGDWHNAAGNEQTLIEHWNGSHWRIVASPSPAGSGADNELDGVAATSRSNAWAVGQFWNGANWQPQIEHWNGKTWRGVKTPDPGGHAARDILEAVVATSPSSAWAVGGYTAGSTGKALILHWNGQAWRQVTVPNPGGTHGSYLNAVTAVSASSIWAVGEYWTATEEKTMVLHWGGRMWRQVASPNAGRGSALAGIGFGSKTSAWATGIYYNASSVEQTLTEHWNGKAWRVVASPDPSGAAQTNEIVASAAAGSQAWAVGNASSGHTYFPLALRWSGTSWKAYTISLPVGTTGAGLWGAGRAPSGNAWAVGDVFNGHTTLTLIEQWTGTGWKRVPSPNR